MKPRLSWIDDTKGIAVLAVTIAHILDVMSPTSTYIQTWCYSWELAAFFVLGGYMFGFNKSGEIPFLKWLRKCICNFGWPYLVFSIIYLMLFRSGLKATVTLFGIGALWFLPAYFFGCLGVHILSKTKFIVCSGCGGIILSAFISWIIEHFFYETVWIKDGIFPLTMLSRVLTAGALMYLGFVMFCYQDIIKKKLISKNRIKAICLLIIGGVLASVNGEVNLRYGYYGNVFLFYIGSVSTILAFVMFTKIKSFKIFNYCGRNSIKIFLLQNLIVRLVSRIKDICCFSSLNIGYQILIIVGVFVLSIGGAIIFSELINRTPLKMLVIFKRKEKNNE